MNSCLGSNISTDACGIAVGIKSFIILLELFSINKSKLSYCGVESGRQG